MTLTCTSVEKLDGYNVKKGSNGGKNKHLSGSCSSNQKLTKPVVKFFGYSWKSLDRGACDGHELCTSNNNLLPYIDCAGYVEGGVGFQNRDLSPCSTNSVYSCPGNREYHETPSTHPWLPPASGINFRKYSVLKDTSEKYIDSGRDASPGKTTSIVKHTDMNNPNPRSDVSYLTTNSIREFLRQEISERRNHIWYSAATAELGNDIQSGNIIDSVDQRTVFTVLKGLKDIIENKKDFRDDDAKNLAANRVYTGSLIETKNLRYMERGNTLYRGLYGSAVDCICYSDCVQFYLYVSRKCTCNLNCICNYG